MAEVIYHDAMTWKNKRAVYFSSYQSKVDQRSVDPKLYFNKEKLSIPHKHSRQLKKNSIMCCFLFLRLVLLLYLHFVAEATQIGEITDFGIYTRGADELDSNDRIAKLEAHNRHQDKEIYFLKNTVEEERKISHQLRDRVAKLEESNDPHKIIRRPKRPVRLLPPYILR